MLEVVLDLGGCCQVWGCLVAGGNVGGYCRGIGTGFLCHFDRGFFDWRQLNGEFAWSLGSCKTRDFWSHRLLYLRHRFP